MMLVSDEKNETDCLVVDLSSGGACIRCDRRLPANTKVVLHVAGFGRFAGVTTAPENERTGISFACTTLIRQRVQKQLNLLVEAGLEAVTKHRTGDAASYRGVSNFTRSNGEVADYEIMDLWLTGAALQTASRPAIGELVQIARRVAHVTRYIENGISVQFVGYVQ